MAGEKSSIYDPRWYSNIKDDRCMEFLLGFFKIYS